MPYAFHPAPPTLYPSADTLFPASSETLTWFPAPHVEAAPPQEDRPAKPKSFDVEKVRGGARARKLRKGMQERATLRSTVASAAWRVLRREMSATVVRLASELGVTTRMAGRAVGALVAAGTVVKIRKDNYDRHHSTDTIYALADKVRP